jgi:hypothetical protein
MRLGYHPEPYWWNILIRLFRPLEHLATHGHKSDD